jgi:voltage-gated potassium channel
MPSGRVADRIQRRIGLGQSRGPAVARHEVRRFARRLALLIGALNLLLLGGAGAFALSEHVSYWQGFLWALDTVATVGSIPQPDRLGGQLTKVVLITLGLGTMLYVLITLTELFVAGDLSGLVEARRMQSKISQLKDHYLVCSFGRVGRQVVRDLRAAGVPFVVIDDNPELREEIEQMEVLHVDGRPYEDEVLIEAGIERARGMIACIDSDAENIFAALTARQLRPDIHVVARAAEDASESKLRAAGADEVVSPYKTSGHAMAKLALQSAGDVRLGALAGESLDAPAAERSAAPK